MIQKSLESIHAQTQEYEVENRPGNRWGQGIFRNMITTWFAAGILKENVHKMLPQKKKRCYTEFLSKSKNTSQTHRELQEERLQGLIIFYYLPPTLPLEDYFHCT